MLPWLTCDLVLTEPWPFCFICILQLYLLHNVFRNLGICAPCAPLGGSNSCSTKSTCSCMDRILSQSPLVLFCTLCKCTVSLSLCYLPALKNIVMCFYWDARESSHLDGILVRCTFGCQFVIITCWIPGCYNINTNLAWQKSRNISWQSRFISSCLLGYLNYSSYLCSSSTASSWLAYDQSGAFGTRCLSSIY